MQQTETVDAYLCLVSIDDAEATEASESLGCSGKVYNNQ